jgi:hypothetical protein
MDAKLPPPPVVMSRQGLTARMSFGASVDAVADAYRMQSEGGAVLALPVHIAAEGAWAFHQGVAAIVERIEPT